MSTKKTFRKPTSNELYEAAIEIDRLRGTIENIDKSIMKLAMKRKEAEMLLSIGTQRFAQMTGDSGFGMMPMNANLVEVQNQNPKNEKKIGFLNEN